MFTKIETITYIHLPGAKGPVKVVLEVDVYENTLKIEGNIGDQQADGFMRALSETDQRSFELNFKDLKRNAEG